MPHVPPHLRDRVVEQDYDQYTAQDQAVWRFVVMQTHTRLLASAHPAYAAGFAAAGIRVERIAHIATMSERLEQLGWSAVCVDGFIPPRAFQAFQAASILPIAADIRSSGHLTYTPAPDIIHEAAGHAPFLADAGYARFLRHIGQVGRRAFSSRFDRALYEAIHALSELKEDPSSTPEQIARAEAAFERISHSAPEPSEAAKVARLYWWTVEYGLIGSLERPQLYGAGLLSSIGEGYFCLGSGVRKLPLTADCVDVGYDITRAQPQLFVAESFEQLDDVLEAVERTLSQRTGGLRGLEVACASQELATLTLDSGLKVIGCVSEVNAAGGSPWLVRLSGPCALADATSALAGWPHGDELLLPLGARDDGRPLSALATIELQRCTSAHGRFELRTHEGVVVSGVPRQHLARDGRLLAVLLDQYELQSPIGQVASRGEPLVLALGAAVTAAEAGAPDGVEPATDPSGLRVPKPRSFDARQRELLALYERALAAFHALGGRELEAACASVVAQLDATHPDEWLLRFNVLESLVKAGEGAALQGKLEADLERLELRFGGREPIATGLAYVRALTGHTPETPGDDARYGR
jgi:phenylalanine-4-hydroxylase